MMKIFTVIRPGLFLVMAGCLLLPRTALSLENKGTDGLRERVEVLDQARHQAAAELSAKEEQGIATDRDREHCRTVTTLLEQRIAASCARLISRGGRTAVSGLPCPDSVMPELERQDQRAKEPETDTTRQSEDEQQENIEGPEKRVEVAAVLPETTAQDRAEPEVVQEPPDQGFWETVRHWWESLFSRKLQASADTTGEPEEQQNAAEEKAAVVEVPSVQDSSLEHPSSAAGPARPEQTEVGDRQRAAQEQPGDRAEQAADLSREAAQPPEGMEQAAEQRGTAGRGREEAESGAAEPGPSEVSRNREKDKASQNQDQSLSETADNTTGSIEKQVQEQPNGGGNSGQNRAAEFSTPGTGTDRDQKQVRSGSVGTGIQEQTGAVLQSGGAAGLGTAAAVAGLEQSLQDALNEFDGRLISEEERLAARVPKQREGSTGGYGSAGFPGSSGGGREQGNGQAGAGGDRGAGSVAASGAQSETGSGHATIDTDDDIVARQLREAAEQETDPVLQEKLWLEYKKYKQGR